MRALVPFIFLLSAPLNIFGVTISLAWLVYIGEWMAICFGVMFAIASAIVQPIALLPAMIFVLPSANFYEKGWKLPGFVFLLASNIYVTSIMIAWSVWVLYFFVARATHDTIIPILGLSYGVGTACWGYDSKRDGDSFGTMLNSIFIQLASAVVAVSIYLNPMPILDIIAYFCLIMMFPVIINSFIGHEMFVQRG